MWLAACCHTLPAWAKIWAGESNGVSPLVVGWAGFAHGLPGETPLLGRTCTKMGPEDCYRANGSLSTIWVLLESLQGVNWFLWVLVGMALAVGVCLLLWSSPALALPREVPPEVSSGILVVTTGLHWEHPLAERGFAGGPQPQMLLPFGGTAKSHSRIGPPQQGRALLYPCPAHPLCTLPLLWGAVPLPPSVLCTHPCPIPSNPTEQPGTWKNDKDSTFPA